MLPFPNDLHVGPEADQLVSILDQQRATVLWKLEGLSEDLARRSTVESGTTVLGLVKHLGWMEHDHFASDIGGEEINAPWSAGSPNGDFELDDDDTVASVTRFYADAVRASNEIIAAKGDLDFVGGTRDRPVSLRWVIAHMIEETARHLGHIDIIREQLDGVVGYMPDPD